jgi:hypothetical protein
MDEDGFIEVKLGDGGSIDSVAKRIIEASDNCNRLVHFTVRSSFNYHGRWNKCDVYGRRLDIRLKELGYDNVSETREEQNGRIYNISKMIV